MYNAQSAEVLADDGERGKLLPVPAGYRLLISPLEVQAKTDGGILRPDELVGREEVASVVGFVLDVGPDAYGDPKRFPNGPWCKKGDFVVFRSYSGTRLKIRGKEFRLLNDDAIEAVVDDPRGIERA